MSNEAQASAIEEIDEMTEEELQQIADIKREELAETPPTNGAQAPAGTEIDPKALSLNEKYELILGQVKQTGPLFFVQVNPEVFALPENDPLYLVWINIITGWKIASTILAQFDRTLTPTETADESNAESTESDTETSAVNTDSTPDKATDSEDLAAESE